MPINPLIINKPAPGPNPSIEFKGCNFLNIAAELPEGHMAVRAMIKKMEESNSHAVCRNHEAGGEGTTGR